MPTLIGNLESTTAPVSLYQHPTGEYVVWIQIGVALLEIKEDDLPEVINSLTDIQEIIFQEKTNA